MQAQGGALSQLDYAAVRDAELAMRESGAFRCVRDIVPTKDLKAIFSRSIGPSTAPPAP